MLLRGCGLVQATMKSIISPTLTELVRLYARHHPSLSDQARKLYGYAVTSMERTLGRKLRCSDLSEELILDWMAARIKKVAAKTIKRERSDLLTLWRFARKRGLCSEGPVDIPVVKMPKRQPNSWTVEEYAKIYQACGYLYGYVKGTKIRRSTWWRTLIVFLFYSGCRISAALAVERSDVFLSRRLVRLRAEASKTNYEQYIRLHPEALRAVETQMNHGQNRLWPYPYSHRKIFTVYKTILQNAGLPDDRACMFQRTRRTCYTLCVRFGSLDVASRQLGHQTDMSRFYLDESQLSPRQAADILPAF